MKKLLSLALAIALCFSLAVPALAAGKTGDTTVTDTKGNIYTLSKPVLYTISVSELDGVQEIDTDGFFGRIKEEVSIIYAISNDTLIKAPSGIRFDCVLGSFIEEDDGTLYTVAPIGPGPGWTEFQVEAGWEGGIFMFPCYTTSGAEQDVSVDFVDNIAFFVPLDETAGNPFTISTQTNPVISSKPTFTDVTDSAYYAAPVAWAVEKNITTGTTETTFSPNNTCTTAQILTFLWRAKGSPEPTSRTNSFTDIKESDYYYKAALWAKENSLISGTTFNGNTPCTRAATMTYMWKLAGSPSTSSAAFTDVPGSANYAQAVAWAVSENITTGITATTFSPDATCTRAQIVTFLYRAYAD